MGLAEIIDEVRAEFPALARSVAGERAIFFDGPAGTQVPQTVVDAISRYLVECNANSGGQFATSRESDSLLEGARGVFADFFGVDDHDMIIFGPNMTTMTFALSRALARTWNAGDEIIVTRLDHDANVTPWVLAGRDAGAVVKYVDINPDDCRLDMNDFANKLSERTRLVAVGLASNALGTINPVEQICGMARDVRALSFIDAVHYAPHGLIDIPAIGCDFLCCSAYKFFGPHVGIMWGRRDLLEELDAYKVRPAPDSLPGKWMTGTQNHECIAGAAAAVEYLASLGHRLAEDHTASLRIALAAAFAAIERYEQELITQLIEGVQELPGFKVRGITRAKEFAERVPTVSITHESISPRALCGYLADRSIFAWHGNYYALPLTERLGLEPDGMVRIGLVHYNTQQEVDRLLNCLSECVESV